MAGSPGAMGIFYCEWCDEECGDHGDGDGGSTDSDSERQMAESCDACGFGAPSHYKGGWKLDRLCENCVCSWTCGICNESCCEKCGETPCADCGMTVCGSGNVQELNTLTSARMKQQTGIGGCVWAHVLLREKRLKCGHAGCALVSDWQAEEFDHVDGLAGKCSICAAEQAKKDEENDTHKKLMHDKKERTVRVSLPGCTLCRVRLTCHSVLSATLSRNWG